MHQGVSLSQEDVVSRVWKDSLYDPVENFLSRPRKDFRSELVRVGFALHQNSEMTLAVSYTHLTLPTKA